MAAILKSRFVLAVPRLDRSVSYYRDQLGLALEFTAPGWAFMSRGSFSVMLGECPDATHPSRLGDHSYFGYITVDDAESLYAEYLGKGLEFIKELTDEPWAMREFGLRTIDGHRIMFGQELS